MGEDRDQQNEAITDLLERMDVQLAEWDEDEPRDDWWNYQRDFALAREAIVALQGNHG